MALVQANLGNASLGGAVEAIESALDSLIQWPADMTYFITGQSEEWQRSQNSLLMAMALSVFLVYVIMASQFESLTAALHHHVQCASGLCRFGAGSLGHANQFVRGGLSWVDHVGGYCGQQCDCPGRLRQLNASAWAHGSRGHHPGLVQ